jgi:microcin C transport system permease protein
MKTYIIRRLLLIVPTIFGILLVNFVIVQFTPGGPVERIFAQYAFGSNARLDTHSAEYGSSNQTEADRGAEPSRPALIRELENRFGFDKPAHVRFINMTWNYLRFDFGKSYYRNESVLNIIIEKFPVSLSLAFWSTAIMYLFAIPLGIRKAVKDGTQFDTWSSIMMNVFCAIPGFILAVLLIILFAGGSYFNIFPIRGLVSGNWQDMNLWSRVIDYLWHITLPVICMALSGFAVQTMLTKNSFADELNKLYVTTARSKGLTERAILFRHVFRNAMLIVISTFPLTFLSMLFTGSMLIEIIFSLDGIGLLGFQSILTRDYPIVFATLYIYTLAGLIFKLISDIMLTLIDPRINFNTANV